MRIHLSVRFTKLLLLLSLASTAGLRGGHFQDRQETTISGVVTSSDDKSSLPGVNVLIKGTTAGTTTDADASRHGKETFCCSRSSVIKAWR